MSVITDGSRKVAASHVEHHSKKVIITSEIL